MPDRAWKRQERNVAAMMGSRRNPNTGEHRIDIDADPFAVEHKARRRLPGWLMGALRQAQDGADGRTPIVVLSEVRQGIKARRYVVLALEDWLAWHGPGKQAGDSGKPVGAAEIKLRAERRAEEMLAEMEKQAGARSTGLQRASPLLADLGIEATQSHRWQREASVPEAAGDR